MRPLLLALLPLLLAAQAHALGGVVRVLGDAVTLERDSGSTLLLAEGDEGRRVLAQLAQFAGQHAFVEGRADGAGFVVTKLVSPFRNEADVLVAARPGRPGELVARMGSSAGMAVVGPQASLLAPFVNREVRLRAWFFLDGYGSQPNACAPVAVRHTPPVGDSAWILEVDGAQARGRDAEGQGVTLPLADVQAGPVRGRAGRVTGTLRAGGDAFTLVDGEGRAFTIGGGEGVLPLALDAFDGRDGVELEGTIVAGEDRARPTLLVERVLSPAPARLTGRVTKGALRVGGRELTLLGEDHRGLLDLLAGLDGQEVTLKGFASATALHVEGVAARVEGPVAGTKGFQAPADGQVWISLAGRGGGAIVTADGQPGYAQVPADRIAPAPRPTHGLAGSLGPSRGR
jgi:hypothetical protein